MLPQWRNKWTWFKDQSTRFTKNLTSQKCGGRRNLVQVFRTCLHKRKRTKNTFEIFRIPIVIIMHLEMITARIRIKIFNNTGSCFGFRVPVFCNASLFLCNAPAHYTTCSGRGWAHYEIKLVPETTNKNHCYCRPHPNPEGSAEVIEREFPV